MTRRPRRRALYATFEGIDGAGKSTVVRRVASRLRRMGIRVAVRREPASADLSRHAQRASVQDPWTGAVYFTLDRYLARPALDRQLASASIVLSDRSFWSTLAYQGSALPPRARRTLTELQSAATVAPDHVILIDVDPPIALRRIGARAGRRSPLERRRTLERVARAYHRYARQNGWTVIDGTAPIADVVEAAVRSIAAALSARAAARAPRRS